MRADLLIRWSRDARWVTQQILAIEAEARSGAFQKGEAAIGAMLEARSVRAEPLDVERLGAAMEEACDALSVTSLCPADAPILFARLSESPEPSGERP
jgi:hypothetical protein